MELYHHGIKGQKWGIRRYRYADGSLTPLGRERYGIGLKKNSGFTTMESKLSYAAKLAKTKLTGKQYVDSYLKAGTTLSRIQTSENFENFAFYATYKKQDSNKYMGLFGNNLITRAHADAKNAEKLAKASGSEEDIKSAKALKEICAATDRGRLPPTGTGDCCAPKLLDHCYKNALLPVSMCEVYYGNDSGTKKAGKIYGPCDERCGIILPEILGLKILYRDEDIVVVDKQSGLLSVPGRGPEKIDSVEARFRRIYGDAVEISQPAVHRLDMETSGIMILAFKKETHREMNMAFERGDVQKEYVALLDGVLAKKRIPDHGQNELYFRLDVDNRPHQIWDEVYGKKAITEWNVLDVEIVFSVF